MHGALCTRVRVRANVSKNMKRSIGMVGTREGATPPPKRPAAAHWSKGLLASMEDPGMIVASDDRTVMIRDKYPKAKHHYLVLPREDISSMKSLDISHVPLLEHMLRVAKEFVSKLSKPKLEFQYGFHTAASMARLHMHVISRDFDSVHLKTKRHWNTFTTEFFMNAQTVISSIEVTGRLELMDKVKCDMLLKRPLQCHVCGEELATMPKLKMHIKRHVFK